MLAAAIDRRVGGKTLSKGIDNWADVKNAMDFWALQADYRACTVAGLGIVVRSRSPRCSM